MAVPAAPALQRRSARHGPDDGRAASSPGCGRAASCGTSAAAVARPAASSSAAAAALRQRGVERAETEDELVRPRRSSRVPRRCVRGNMLSLIRGSARRSSQTSAQRRQAVEAQRLVRRVPIRPGRTRSDTTSRASESRRCSRSHRPAASSAAPPSRARSGHPASSSRSARTDPRPVRCGRGQQPVAEQARDCATCSQIPRSSDRADAALPRARHRIERRQVERLLARHRAGELKLQRLGALGEISGTLRAAPRAPAPPAVRATAGRSPPARSRRRTGAASRTSTGGTSPGRCLQQPSRSCAKRALKLTNGFVAGTSARCFCAAARSDVCSSARRSRRGATDFTNSTYGGSSPGRAVPARAGRRRSPRRAAVIAGIVEVAEVPALDVDRVDGHRRLDVLGW